MFTLKHPVELLKHPIELLKRSVELLKVRSRVLETWPRACVIKQPMLPQLQSARVTFTSNDSYLRTNRAAPRYFYQVLCKPTFFTFSYKNFNNLNKIVSFASNSLNLQNWFTFYFIYTLFKVT